MSLIQQGTFVGIQQPQRKLPQCTIPWQVVSNHLLD